MVWTGRLGLAWQGDDSVAGKVADTVPVALFVLLGVTGLVVVFRASRGRVAGNDRLLGLGIAGWTVAYWMVRLPIILAHSHPAGFKAVHALLAIVSWALAGWTWRALTTSARPAVSRPS